MRILQHIPNLLTLGNLLMGCIAIICFLSNGYTLLDYNTVTEDYTVRFLSADLVQGVLFMWVAVAIDFVDGWTARLLRAQSSLGQQLDSLCDLVSFGVAPSILVYQVLKYSWSLQNNTLSIPTAYLLPALLIAVAAAYRLAKFNIRGNQHDSHFRGVPTPVVALGLSGLPFVYVLHPAMKDFIFHPLSLYLLIAFWCLLMVSNRPMYKLSFSFKKHLSIVMLLSLGLVSVFGIYLVGYAALLFVAIMYVFLSYAFLRVRQ